MYVGSSGPRSNRCVIYSGFGPLSTHTLATNATHTGGYVELDVHNMWGLMEEKITHLAVQGILTGKRPFLISRSTFPSSGRWTGHWLGDNYSKWQYMYFNIQGMHVLDLRFVLVYLLTLPRRPIRRASVPDISDTNGRCRYLWLPREYRRRIVQSLDAVISVYAVLPKPQSEGFTVAGAVPVG